MTREQRRLAAIVSMDAVGYSRLMGRDESATLAAFKAHRRELIDPKIAEHGGRIVKSMGDGLLVEFASVVDAVRCSVEVQRAMAERNAAVPPDQQIVFRFGINVGDIIIEGEDIFGDGVNVAARLQALAEPGGICVSRAVRDQVLDKLDFAFEALGSKEVKNIARPVEVYRVALGGAAPRAVHDLRHEFPTRARRPTSRLRALGIGALIIALGGAGWIATRAWLQPAAVVPYSAQDRRMTFAVLPFTAPAGDAQATELAVAMTNAVQAMQESNSLRAVVAARPAVERAVAKHASTQDLAKALNVHFLIRGNVARTPSGLSLELRLVDASTERVLDTRSIAMVPGPLTARNRHELDDALGWMTYEARLMEVEWARHKPLEAMDVRDLTFRAYADWGKEREQDGKRAYTSATELLNRALALAPDDSYALHIMATVNLCDCLEGWSRNVAEQQAVGFAALEKFLRRNPGSIDGLNQKAGLFAFRGQYEESLVLADTVLKKESENAFALHNRAFALLRLGRPQEALPAVNQLLEFEEDDPNVHVVASSVHYQLGNDELAASHAQKAVAKLASEYLSNGNIGSVLLTWIAAEGRLGRQARARTALATFHSAVPAAKTVSAMRAWMKPNADLAGYEPLFDGLRRAGVPE